MADDTERKKAAGPRPEVQPEIAPDARPERGPIIEVAPYVRPDVKHGPIVEVAPHEARCQARSDRRGCPRNQAGREEVT
jgi:hypothetical protein